MALDAPKPIESKRLIVRLVGVSDLPALLKVNGNEAVTRFLPYASWRSMADAKAWWARMEAIQNTGTALQFVIVEKASMSVIGSCLLFHFDARTARAELGYVLGESHWGQGYMHEALSALIAHTFAALPVRELQAEIVSDNLPSARLLLRLGFSKADITPTQAKEKEPGIETYTLTCGQWQGG